MKYVIVGGTSGIGEVMVRKLVERGDYIIFFGRNVDKGLSLVEELGRGKCAFHQLDITSEGAFENLKDALSQQNSIRGCINFAGVMYLSKLLDYEVSDWVEMAKVNYIGLLNVVGAILPKLPEGSVFFNISSVAALNPSVGNAAYAASKKAADIIIDVLRKECVASGIKVGTIRLGGVDTDINSKIRNSQMRRTITLRTKTYTPMCANALVDQIVKLMDMPSGINIADVFFTPTDQPD